MRTRKTIEVARVKQLMNHYLDSATAADEGKLAVASLLEILLHETGNYKGFRYLDGSQAVIDGDYDETRREYL